MTLSLSVSASRPKVKHPQESLRMGIDFTRLLAANETLAGTPMVTASPDGLALEAPAVNAEPFANDEGGAVAAGAGVLVRVSGGAAGTDYTLTVICGTSTGNTRAGVCTLQVRSS
jgi:hypothetical protein